MAQTIISLMAVGLFIFLALAGAYYLGGAFQESANKGRAAAVVQVVSQVSHAYSLYQVQEGRLPPGLSNLVSQGYMKAIPANPTSTATEDAISLGTNVLEMRLGGNAQAICNAVAKQTNGVDVAPTALPSDQPVGCYGSGAEFRAYARL